MIFQQLQYSTIELKHQICYTSKIFPFFILYLITNFMFYFMFHKQNKKISSQMQDPQCKNNEQIDDIQIDYLNCCTPFVRHSNSSHSIDNPKKQQSKSSKQKGILLTSKAKSSSRLQQPIKLVITKSQPLTLQPKIQANSPLLNKHSSQNVSSKRILTAQRCIDYKNKKIQEHKQNQSEQSYSKLQTPRKEYDMLCSTRKNTARTLKNSEDPHNFNKNAMSFFNNLAVQRSVLKIDRQYKINIRSELCINTQESRFKISPAKKTLEKVFQETTGKRIVTLQSEPSNEDQQQSFAQSFIFPS